MTIALSFGEAIKNARKNKGLSQKRLAYLIDIDYTYLSKLENNRVDYPPREEIIRALAQNLDLNEEELIFLAGRIPRQDCELLKQHYQAMSVLFRRIRENPSLTEEILFFLAGRIPQGYTKLLKQHYQNMPALFYQLRENPTFTEQILKRMEQIE